jgi:hypothetical protein
MRTTQEVIYRAANVEQAYLLCNMLEERGIGAEVTNAMLQQAAGDLPYGGPIEPRVVVDAADAPDARRIAAEFDQIVSRARTLESVGGRTHLESKARLSTRLFLYCSAWYAAWWWAALLTAGTGLEGWPVAVGMSACFVALTTYFVAFGKRHRPCNEDRALVAEADDTTAPVDHWPTCPSCSRRRHTSCPICETSGTDFEQGYMPTTTAASDTVASDTGALLVLCPTCDEPFEPQFPSRCEWCGYRFADGHELTVRRGDDVEVNLRLWAAGICLVIVVMGTIAFLAYFTLPR